MFHCCCFRWSVLFTYTSEDQPTTIIYNWFNAIIKLRATSGKLFWVDVYQFLVLAVCSFSTLPSNINAKQTFHRTISTWRYIVPQHTVFWIHPVCESKAFPRMLSVFGLVQVGEQKPTSRGILNHSPLKMLTMRRTAVNDVGIHHKDESEFISAPFMLHLVGKKRG